MSLSHKDPYNDAPQMPRAPVSCCNLESFLMGRSLRERFDEKWRLNLDTGCHEWIAARDDAGYARISVNGRQHRGHRVIFLLEGIDIPSCMEVDHLCRNRACVNIEHLEPVMAAINVARGESPTARNSRKTHCPRGHAYSEDNIYRTPKHPNRRWCLTCKTTRNRRSLPVLVTAAIVLLSSACLTDAQLARLANCESGGRPTVVSDSGKYHGLYQFDQGTWNGVARRHAPHLVGVRPSAASKADQDAMARHLHSERGRSPWPVCGRRI